MMCIIRDLAETIESGPLFITDLFKNKSVAYFLLILHIKVFINYLSSILCNLSMRTQKILEIFFALKKLKKLPKKLQLGVVFFSAAPTAQNSPELHFRFIVYGSMYYERTTVQQKVRALILHFFPPRFRWGGTSTTSSLIRFSLSGSAITKKTDVYTKEVQIVYRLLIHTALKHIEWNKSCTSEVFTMLRGSFSN